MPVLLIARPSLDEVPVVPMRVVMAELIRDPAYRIAHLLTAAALSKGIKDLGISFNPRGITLPQNLIDQFRANFEQLFALARSA